MPIEYAWERKDLPMPEGYRTTDHKRVFIIDNVQIEDGGDYTCHATRGISARAEKTHTLTIEGFQTFTCTYRRIILMYVVFH